MNGWNTSRLVSWIPSCMLCAKRIALSTNGIMISTLRLYSWLAPRKICWRRTFCVLSIHSWTTTFKPELISSVSVLLGPLRSGLTPSSARIVQFIRTSPISRNMSMVTVTQSWMADVATGLLQLLLKLRITPSLAPCSYQGQR
jgi:hypothetical protein